MVLALMSPGARPGTDRVSTTVKSCAPAASGHVRTPSTSTMAVSARIIGSLDRVTAPEIVGIDAARPAALLAGPPWRLREQAPALLRRMRARGKRPIVAVGPPAAVGLAVGLAGIAGIGAVRIGLFTWDELVLGV